MKLIKSELATAVKKTLPAILPSTIRVLEFFRLHTEEETLYLTGVNELYSITSTVCNTLDEINILVEARLFSDVVTASEGEVIELSLKDEILTVKTETGNYSLNTLSPAEYPPVKFEPESDGVTIALGELISQVESVCQKGAFRENMQGVCIMNGVSAATDGHRLLKYNPEGVEYSVNESVTIPKAAASAIFRIFGSAKVYYSTTKTQARIEADGTTFITKLISERFPDIDQVIPVKYDYEYIVNRENLLKACHRMKLVNRNKVQPLVKLHFKDNALTITTQDLETQNTGSETMQYKGDTKEMLIGFNTQYLIDMLVAYDVEELTLRGTTPSRAWTVTSEKKLGLIMPLRLSEV